MSKLIKVAILLLFAGLCSASAQGLSTSNTASGTFPGSVEGKCVLKSPVRDAVTLVADERDADGFVIKLSAETGDRRLRFQLRCNGARITVRFSHPQLEATSPALAPNSRFYTVVAMTGAGNGGNTTRLGTPNNNGELVVNRNSDTDIRNMFVGFAIRNGADANIPFLAGTYVFKFTATIEAGL